ncbi:unnamed protein product, partial [Amoebophrya sp. A25]|eukprot:GSA25T00008547001.1
MFNMPQAQQQQVAVAGRSRTPQSDTLPGGRTSTAPQAAQQAFNYSSAQQVMMQQPQQQQNILQQQNLLLNQASAQLQNYQQQILLADAGVLNQDALQQEQGQQVNVGEIVQQQLAARQVPQAQQEEEQQSGTAIARSSSGGSPGLGGLDPAIVDRLHPGLASELGEHGDHHWSALDGARNWFHTPGNSDKEEEEDGNKSQPLTGRHLQPPRYMPVVPLGSGVPFVQPTNTLSPRPPSPTAMYTNMKSASKLAKATWDALRQINEETAMALRINQIRLHGGNVLDLDGEGGMTNPMFAASVVRRSLSPPVLGSKIPFLKLPENGLLHANATELDGGAPRAFSSPPGRAGGAYGGMNYRSLFGGSSGSPTHLLPDMSLDFEEHLRALREWRRKMVLGLHDRDSDHLPDPVLRRGRSRSRSPMTTGGGRGGGVGASATNYTATVPMSPLGHQKIYANDATSARVKRMLEQSAMYMKAADEEEAAAFVQRKNRGNINTTTSTSNYPVANSSGMPSYLLANYAKTFSNSVHDFRIRGRGTGAAGAAALAQMNTQTRPQPEGTVGADVVSSAGAVRTSAVAPLFRGVDVGNTTRSPSPRVVADMLANPAVARSRSVPPREGLGIIPTAPTSDYMESLKVNKVKNWGNSNVGATAGKSATSSVSGAPQANATSTSAGTANAAGTSAATAVAAPAEQRPRSQSVLPYSVRLKRSVSPLDEYHALRSLREARKSGISERAKRLSSPPFGLHQGAKDAERFRALRCHSPAKLLVETDRALAKVRARSAAAARILTGEESPFRRQPGVHRYDRTRGTVLYAPQDHAATGGEVFSPSREMALDHYSGALMAHRQLTATASERAARAGGVNVANFGNGNINQNTNINPLMNTSTSRTAGNILAARTVAGLPLSGAGGADPTVEEVAKQQTEDTLLRELAKLQLPRSERGAPTNSG